MKKRIDHRVEISADNFYETIYFNEDFNAKLYAALRFRERRILKQEDRGDTVYREVLQVPERDLPGPIKKALGAEQLAYTEKSLYDRKTGKVDIDIVSSVKPDKVKVQGVFWVEPAGPDHCQRLFELEVKVDIFAIGGMIEKLIMEDVVRGYDQSADFTNRWLAEHRG
jgi:hypothetical protein